MTPMSESTSQNGSKLQQNYFRIESKLNKFIKQNETIIYNKQIVEMRPNQAPNLPVNNPATNPPTNEQAYYNRYTSTIGNNVDNNTYSKYNRFNNESQAINYTNNSIQPHINYTYGNMYPTYGMYNHQYIHNQPNPNLNNPTNTINPINPNTPNSVNIANQMNTNTNSQENPYQQYNQYIPNPNTRNNNYYSNNRYSQPNMNNQGKYNKPNNQYNRDIYNSNPNNSNASVGQNNYNNNTQQSYYNRNNHQNNQYRNTNPNPNYSNEVNKNTKSTERYDNQITKIDKKNQNLHKNYERKTTQTPRYKPEDRNQAFNDDQQAFQSDSYQSEQEDQEQLYHKTKQIAKKKDPILDSPSEIKKWIQARKRNYPKSNADSNKQEQNNKLSGQMSILESKIRKKIMIISGDSRGLIKKLKNMHILKRIVGDIGKNTTKVVSKKRNNNFKEKQKLRINKINQEKAQQEKNKRQAEIIQKKQKQLRNLPQNISQNSSENSDQPEQIPICKIPPNQVPVPIEKDIKPLISELPKANTQNMIQNEGRAKSTGFTPQQMIKHLKQKQDEDKQFFSKLLNYNTNSLNYKYSVGTLETNFVLEDIFEESSYLLQIIRHIIKNGFFDKK